MHSMNKPTEQPQMDYALKWCQINRCTHKRRGADGERARALENLKCQKLTKIYSFNLAHVHMAHTPHTHKQIACTLLTEPLNSQTSISSVHCSFSTLCYAVLRSSFYGCIESIFVCRKHNTFRQCAPNVSIEPKPNSHTATDTHGHHVICFRSFNLFVFMRRGTSTTRSSYK